MSYCARRGIHGHGIAAYRNPDALGKPDYGYIRRHGACIPSSVEQCDERQTAKTQFVHNNPGYVAVYHFHRTDFRRHPLRYGLCF